MNYRQKLNKEILEYYKKYPWRKTFSVIKQRCTNPNNKSFKHYGAKGIKCRIYGWQLKKLWFRDKAYLMNKPNISRKNHDKDYTYNNCEYIEKSENSAERNTRVSSKPILQYDLQGNFIREWKSRLSAQKELQINNIWHCLNGIYKQSGGFIWRYKNE